MMNVWLSGERLQVSELRPENKALFRISKTPRVKPQEHAFDVSLADSKTAQHKHDIACHKMNTANMLQPVVHSITAKERTPTERYSLNGISLSAAQFNELTK
jgi:hypothetical protein